MNTNLHVTYSQAVTLLEAVRYQLYRDTSGGDRTHLEAAEKMMVAAVCRIQDAQDRRDKKGVWA